MFLSPAGEPRLWLLLLLLGLLVVLGVLLRSALERRALLLRHGLSQGKTRPDRAPETRGRVDAEPSLGEGEPLSEPNLLGHDPLNPDYELVFLAPALPAAILESVTQDVLRKGHIGSKPLRVARPGPEALQIGLLLANRGGPLSLVDYQGFAQWLSDRIPGLSSQDVQDRLPDFAHAYRQSRQALAVIDELDGQLVLHVQGATPSDAMLAAFARELSWEPRGEGRFSCLDSSGRLQFSVMRGDAGQALTLMLDLPRSRNPERAFAMLREAANRFVDAIEGQIVDDRGHPLGESALELVTAQLLKRIEAFHQRGLEPGSDLALRLFQ